VTSKVEIIKPVLKNSIIPDFFVGREWNEEEFYSSHGNYKTHPTVKKYVQTLLKYQKSFAEGSLPDRSLFVSAPPGFGKKIFAYACYQYALQHGYTIAPLLDTQEIKYIFAGKDGNAYEEYISKDVLVFTIPSDRVHWYSSQTMIDLYQRRARRNKITIGISRFRIQAITQSDRGEFKDFVYKPPPFLGLEVPLVVMCDVK
jgi:hypothetical protein